MKPLLPLLAALLAFAAGRFLTPPPASAPPTAPPPPRETKTSPRPPSGGLAHRAAQISSTLPGDSLRPLHGAEMLPLSELSDLLAAHAVKDPEAAWDWVESHQWPHNFQRSELLKIVASAWFAKAPQAVISRLRAFDHRDWYIAASLVGKIASSDAAEAALAREHLDTLVAFSGNFREDIQLPSPGEGGAELLLSLPDGRSRDLLIGLFARRWLENDPKAAAAWLDQFPPSQKEDILAQFSSSAVLSGSPEFSTFARDWLMNEASPSTRARLGPALVEAMAKQDPAAALAWANENLSSGSLATATAKVIATLQTQNPDLARQTVEDLPPGNLRHRAATELAKGWAARDPAAAVTWWLGQVTQAEAAKAGIGHSRTLGEQWFKQDPDSFRRHLADPAAIDLPATMIDPAIDDMVKADIPGSLDWIATLPGARRETALDAAFNNLARQNLPAAAEAFAARPDLATPRAAGRIASVWFDRDPNGAISWAADLPAGEARQAALETLKKQAEFEVQLGGEMPARLEELLR